MAKGHPDFFIPQAYQILSDTYRENYGPTNIPAPGSADLISIAGIGFTRASYVQVVLDDIASTSLIELILDTVPVGALQIRCPFDLRYDCMEYLPFRITLYDYANLTARIELRAGLSFRKSLRIVATEAGGIGATLTAETYYVLAI